MPGQPICRTNSWTEEKAFVKRSRTSYDENAFFSTAIGFPILKTGIGTRILLSKSRKSRSISTPNSIPNARVWSILSKNINSTLDYHGSHYLYWRFDSVYGSMLTKWLLSSMEQWKLPNDDPTPAPPVITAQRIDPKTRVAQSVQSAVIPLSFCIERNLSFHSPIKMKCLLVL